MLHSRVLTQDLGILIFTHRVNSCNLLIASTASTYSPRKQLQLTHRVNSLSSLSCPTISTYSVRQQPSLLTASTTSTYSPRQQLQLTHRTTTSSYSPSQQLQLTHRVQRFSLLTSSKASAYFVIFGCCLSCLASCNRDTSCSIRQVNVNSAISLAPAALHVRLALIVQDQLLYKSGYR